MSSGQKHFVQLSTFAFDRILTGRQTAPLVCRLPNWQGGTNGGSEGKWSPLPPPPANGQDSVCTGFCLQQQPDSAPALREGDPAHQVPGFHRKISDLCRLNVLIEHVGCKTFSFICEVQYIFLLVSCVKCLSTFSLGARNKDASYEVYTM